MKRDIIPVSLLYSTSGAYAALGEEAVEGAMTAISQVNSDPALPFRLEPVIADPGGSAERYAVLAERAINEAGCRHVVGTITSWSRKEVLPLVERRDALLWYAFPYEGFEASANVVYLGPCPNQHLLPLLDYTLPHFGRRPVFVGSNYIWGWENSRIAREYLETAGGEVLADRYMPLGSLETDHLIAEIREKKPDFILSNLVGQSLTAFVKAYGALGQQDDSFSASSCPIISCNATERYFAGLGEAGQGHITASTYFDSLQTSENLAFKALMAARHGGQRVITSPLVSAYVAVSILARAIEDAATDAPKAVLGAVKARQFETPLGAVSVNAKTQHATLRPHLGRSQRTGGFEVLQSAPGAIEADPYLVASPLRPAKPARKGKAATSNPLKVIK